MTKLLITIIFIVSALAGGFYAVYPSYTGYKIKVKEAEILYEELENIVVYVTQLKKIKENIEKNEKDLEKIERAIPEDHDAPALFFYLEEKMKEHGIVTEDGFGGFAVKEYLYEETPHPRIKEVAFSLEFSGRYENVKAFFKDIEKVMRVINVTQIDIVSDSSEKKMFFSETEVGRGFVNVGLVATTYSY
jgi:Tfp pilus assembly protein PilO